MKRWILTGLSFIGFLVVILILIGIIGGLILKIKTEKRGPKIAILKIEGLIENSETYMKYLREIERRKDIKAVVVRINSPGGAVGSSQEIYQELKRISAKKPIVVSMGDVAASGGYYISIAGKPIFALPGTLTGSIGVIFEVPDFEKVLKKLGIKVEVIKSGEFKDTGAPYRGMTPRERAYIKEKIMNIYHQFVRDVARERGLSLSEVKKIADGRIFTGEEAVKLGLVDKIGTLWDAVREAQKKAHLKTYQIVYYPEEKGMIEKILEGKIPVEKIFFPFNYFKAWFVWTY